MPTDRAILYTDLAGTLRGSCKDCGEDECPQYARLPTGSDCEICGHKAARHMNKGKS